MDEVKTPSKSKVGYVRYDPHYHWYLHIPSTDEMRTDFETAEAAIFTVECMGFIALKQGNSPEEAKQDYLKQLEDERLTGIEDKTDEHE